MVQCSRGVYPGFAWHVNHVSKKPEGVNRKYEERPLYPHDIEVIKIQDINAAYERMLKSDVKYRFVIDMASLKSSKR